MRIVVYIFYITLVAIVVLPFLIKRVGQRKNSENNFFMDKLYSDMLFYINYISFTFLINSGSLLKVLLFQKLLKMLYLANLWISQRNGRGTVRTGGRFIPNWRFILRNIWRDTACKLSRFGRLY